VDMAGDLHAVLGPDIAPSPEVLGGDIVGRPLAGVDRGKNVDRRSDPCTWGQLLPVAPANAGIQGNRHIMRPLRFTRIASINGPPGSPAPRASSRCRAHGSRAAPTR